MLFRSRKLFLVVDDAQSAIRLLVLQPDGGGPSGDASARLSGQVLPMTGSRRLSLASARADQPLDSFNGLLEGPSLLGRALSDHEARAGGNFLDDRDCLGNWDFSREMQSRRALDLGPAGRHGELFNSPARGMRGASWDGQEHCYRHAPEQYAAIHFHDDDITDCRWPATHQIDIPSDLQSDAYALMLTAGQASENVPFFVVPARGTANAPIAVLVSTYTYTIYGNHARPEWISDPQWRQAYREQAQQWNAYPHNPGEQIGRAHV